MTNLKIAIDKMAEINKADSYISDRIAHFEVKLAWLSVRVGVLLSDSIAMNYGISAIAWSKYQGRFCFVLINQQKETKPLLGASRELRTEALTSGWIEKLIRQINPHLSELCHTRSDARARIDALEALIEDMGL